MIPIPSDSLAQGLYESIAHDFDTVKAEMASRSIDYYHSLINRYVSKEPQEMKLLDIGAGLGYYSNAFGHLGMQVTYLDGDPISVAFAEKYQKSISTFYYGSAEDYLSSSQTTYDVIFCRHFIEHAFLPNHMITFMLSKLKPDGIIVLETDNNDSSEVLMHPDSYVYWRNVYLEDYDVSDLKRLLKLKVTAISKRNTHWWAFNLRNIEQLVINNSGRVLLKKDYYLGDSYLWPNIGDYKNKVYDEMDNMTQNYIEYIGKTGEGGGMLVLFTHK